MNWILILVLHGMNGGAVVQSAQGFKTEATCQHSVNELTAIDDRREILMAFCKKQGVQ